MARQSRHRKALRAMGRCRFACVAASPVSFRGTSESVVVALSGDWPVAWGATIIVLSSSPSDAHLFDGIGGLAGQMFAKKWLPTHVDGNAQQDE